MKAEHAKLVTIRSSQGFTLIELMIVVAIIGILASIALPQYQTYVAKTQYSRVVGEVGSVKSAVESCMAGGRTAGIGAAINECDMQTAVTGSTIITGANAGVIVPPGTGAPVLTFGAANTATLVATFGNSVAPPLVGGSVVWTRNSTGTWSCSSGGSISSRYTLPSCP
jgi:type IV pilus assembly protein PilA